MSRLTILITLAVFALFVVVFTAPQAFSQTGDNPSPAHGSHFVDENGDGYNDNAPDADGDGIPNGQDPDYERTGRGGRGMKGFVDENGDGINDNAPDADGDGIPNGQDPDFEKQNMGKRFGMGFGHHSKGFIDEDGDGINDRALDDDGDGIPNGMDPDWTRPEDCTGKGLGRGAKMGKGFGKGHKSFGQKSGGTHEPGPRMQDSKP